MSIQKTSWGKVANWYDNLLENKDSYQKNLILPNILRLLNIKKGEVILDLACGQGFFCREFAAFGAKVIGVDISSELIDIAKKRLSNSEIRYYVGSADNIPFIKDQTIDKTTIILSLQNIDNINGVIKECARVLKLKGILYLVLNHPAFRIPKRSSWGFDERKNIQFRRIDGYLIESKEKIQMHPGINPWEKTISFHRPLQLYFKILANNGFSVTRLEEWISPKKSMVGPRKFAEDTARREFPLFLYLECRK